MKINAVNNNYSRTNSKTNGQSFKARTFLSNNVVPYLKAQTTYMAIEKRSMAAAQEWANETWGVLQKLNERLKGLLYPDTPFVVAPKQEAIDSILRNKKTYDGIDGMLVMDGKPFMAPGLLCEEIARYSEPINFKFGPNEELVDKLANKVSEIPLHVAQWFKPHI